MEPSGRATLHKGCSNVCGFCEAVLHWPRDMLRGSRVGSVVEHLQVSERLPACFANRTADVELGFDLVWPDQFGEPPHKTLVAGLYSVSVSATGPFAGDVADGVASGIYSGFYPTNPDPTPNIPSGWKSVTDIKTGAVYDGSNIDVIGMLITTAGSLQLLMNQLPTDSGNLRQYIAQ